jgi:hypothetical protein
MPRRLSSALGVSLAVGLALLAVPVAAAPASASTRLVECRGENCLLVAGHRDDAASIVSINGHTVAVEGAHSWRARLPLDTVRAWSAPYARTIEVSVEGFTGDADLPIGLLGHSAQLATLVVRAE